MSIKDSTRDESGLHQQPAAGPAPVKVAAAELARLMDIERRALSLVAALRAVDAATDDDAADAADRKYQRALGALEALFPDA